MRLSPEQCSEIISVLKSFLKSEAFQVFLYGSRANDALKGGDIDLALVTNNSGIIAFSQLELDILVALKKQPHIGQRKIDIKAFSENEKTSHPFLNSISADWVEIKQPRP